MMNALFFCENNMWLRILVALLFLLLTGCAISFHSINKPGTSQTVKVDISNGKMAAGTGFVNIRPVSFVITNQHCQQTPITTTQNTVTSTIQACYYGNSVFLDPSKLGKRQIQGAIRFNYIPLWQQGFVYNNITSLGYAKLVNADVRIQTQ